MELGKNQSLGPLKETTFLQQKVNQTPNPVIEKLDNNINEIDK